MTADVLFVGTQLSRKNAKSMHVSWMVSLKNILMLKLG